MKNLNILALNLDNSHIIQYAYAIWYVGKPKIMLNVLPNLKFFQRLVALLFTLFVVFEFLFVE